MKIECALHSKLGSKWVSWGYETGVFVEMFFTSKRNHNEMTSFSQLCNFTLML